MQACDLSFMQPATYMSYCHEKMAPTYLVGIQFTAQNANTRVVNYYHVERDKYKWLKNLDFIDKGTCCNKKDAIMMCFVCAVGGADIVFHSRKRIKTKRELAIAKTVANPAFYDVGKLLLNCINYRIIV